MSSDLGASLRKLAAGWAVPTLTLTLTLSLSLRRWAGCLVTVVDTLTFLLVHRLGMRYLEVLICTLIAVVAACFIASAAQALETSADPATLCTLCSLRPYISLYLPISPCISLYLPGARDVLRPRREPPQARCRVGGAYSNPNPNGASASGCSP